MNTEVKIKALAALVGLGGLIFGVVQFIQVQAIEAAKPYLTKKLAWCEEAVETTSRIVTSEPASEVDRQRFEQLYWGVMGLIENQTIEDAMKAFGQGLEDGIPVLADAKLQDSEIVTLGDLSLDLAHACRAELSAEWSASWTRR